MEVGSRPEVKGRFLFVSEEKLWLRGVTYGTFAESINGEQYGSAAQVRLDFQEMVSSGINCVRTYTVPPRWLLDEAQQVGLWVMVGLAWAEHVAFLDDPEGERAAIEEVRRGAAQCANHPALLCLAVGNEIPASIVRWHGPTKIERFIRKLYKAAKEQDPGALVTYVNYPSTEYLNLPFLDFLAVNLYLESEERFSAYIARLHNIAGEKPLVLTELGLDSKSHGVEGQAHSLRWQIREAFQSGCAGAFVFAWTDEWSRGGYEVEDWDFGVTDRRRKPKPALEAVKSSYAELPFSTESGDSPTTFSVVVCSFNGAKTLRWCLEGVSDLHYPAYEVIVVDDGSTDDTAAIAGEFNVQLICTKNHGLSSARNTGLAAASGEIVAYIDDDARPDPDWLNYLQLAFKRTGYVAIGGPNLPPSDSGSVAACVANTPGGPVHVLLSDTVAEHIPGCNMAYRREVLENVGGFDPQFKVAGDDVDICWRLQEEGLTVGFHPGAVVWHYCRRSIRSFWGQQRGYGKAEATLERKWPEKYNVPGHLTWGGRLYGRGLPASLRRSRIFYGVWGLAPFQTTLQASPSRLAMYAGVPEWYLVLLMLGTLSALGAVWSTLLVALPLFVIAFMASVWQAAVGASHAEFGATVARTALRREALRTLTVFLYILQPAARLSGRLALGLTPWRQTFFTGFALPLSRRMAFWFEQPLSNDQRFQQVETALRRGGARVALGSPFDRFEFQVMVGALGAVRLRLAVEEHGNGHQQLLARAWPRAQRVVFWSCAVVGTLFAAAVQQHELPTAVVFAVMLIGLVGAAVYECGVAMHSVRSALEQSAQVSVERSLEKDSVQPMAGRV